MIVIRLCWLFVIVFKQILVKKSCGRHIMVHEAMVLQRLSHPACASI